MKSIRRFSLIAALALLSAQAIPAASLDQMDNIKQVMASQDLAYVQSTTPTTTTNTVVTGSTITVPQLLSTFWNFAVGQGLTNLSVAYVETYTPSIKSWGETINVIRNVNLGGGINGGMGAGFDCYKGNFYAMNAQATISATMTPFSSFGGFMAKARVTPLTYVGLGTPISGSVANGNLETIAATGAAIYIANVIGADLNILGVYGSRTGLGDASGVFYGGGLSLTWLFPDNRASNLAALLRDPLS